MRVAKLSTGRIVQLIKLAPVQFAEGTHALVFSQLGSLTSWKNNPYWVPATQVVWVLDFAEQEVIMTSNEWRDRTPTTKVVFNQALPQTQEQHGDYAVYQRNQALQIVTTR